MKLWLSLGVPREKILIGIPTYGRSFTLASGQKGLHAPGLFHQSLSFLVRLSFILVSGPGYPGRYTKTRGFLSYYEVTTVGSFFYLLSIEWFVLRYANMNTRKVGKKYG